MLSISNFPVKFNKFNNISFKSNDINKSTEPSSDKFVKNKEKKDSSTSKLKLGLLATLVITGSVFLILNTISRKKRLREIDRIFGELENSIPDKVQETFKRVFFRDNLTQAESKKILEGYKDIAKIKSDKEYAQALFEYLKKNFNIHNADMKLVLEVPKGHEGAYGGCSRLNSQIYIAPKTLKEGRKKIFETIHHEMRHAKQNEFIYHKYPHETLEDFMYVEAMNERYGEERRLEAFKCMNNKEFIRELDKKEHISELIEKSFGKPSPQKVPSKYNDYVDRLNYELGTTIHYPDRLEERDAFESSKEITDLFFSKIAQ